MDNEVQERLIVGSKEAENEVSLAKRVWEESKKIWRVALPGVVSRITAFGTIVVTQSFIGHISGLDLAGYALVQTLTARFVNGIVVGMSSATETLCGQAFGAKQYHMMGIYLQRSWIVDFLTVTVLLPFFVFAKAIFELIGEEKSIASAGGYVSLWFIPFIYSFVFSLTIQMYLQAQLKNMIIAWLSFFMLVVHVPLSWLFVNKLNWGVPGAMGALAISAWFFVGGEFGYIFGGWCPNTWTGFTMLAFKDLWPVIKLSVASGFMFCLEIWYTAILVVIAGYMKDAEVAISALSICLNINTWELMISIGFLGAACTFGIFAFRILERFLIIVGALLDSVRVANELGRGDAKAAKFSIKVLLGTSVVIGVFFWIICLAFGHRIGYLFTNDDAVAETVSDLSTLLAFLILLNSIYPVLSGVAVGAGLQGTVAIVNLCCYYVIGVPIGAVLGYVFHLQIKGMWIGMMCGVIIQTLALIYIACKTDWNNEVKKAAERLGRWYVKTSNESNEI